MNQKMERTSKEFQFNHDGITARVIFTDVCESPWPKKGRISSLLPPMQFVSSKCKRTVELHSRLACHYARLLENDPDVIKYQERPLKIEYTDTNGMTFLIIPDFIVNRRNGSKTVEKLITKEKIMFDGFARKMIILKRLSTKLGFEFRLIGSDSIMRIVPIKPHPTSKGKAI